MSGMKWQDMQSALRTACKAPEPRPAAEFWAEFNRRVAAMPAEALPATAASLPLSFPWARPLRWAAAALVAALLTLPVLLRQGAQAPARNHDQANSELEEIEVFVPYSTMMIMQDRESGGTVVWLADLNKGA